MTESVFTDVRIPQYLQYKAEYVQADQSCAQELERVNTILHGRVLRVDRDKLCTGCARFDWVRTQMYTCEATWWGRQLPAEYKKVKNDGSLENLFFGYRDLTGIEDNINWHKFELTAGVSRDVEPLIDHPEFKWRLGINQEYCTFCDLLLELLTPTILSSKEKAGLGEIVVSLSKAPIFEQGGKHRCYVGWQEDAQQPTNILSVQIDAKIGRDVQQHRCYIRPLMCKEQLQPEASVHCCVLQRELKSTVDFELLAMYLQKCDADHQHSSESPSDIRELANVRLIDVQRRCLVKGSLRMRYAALSYTWGSGERLCLTKQNSAMLEKPDSLWQARDALGQTVVDSITACARLGIPYLWIDALCIAQDDAENKHQQIHNMDRIYASAYVTLVAASEKYSHASSASADAGLSRVSTPGPLHRTHFTMDGMSYTLIPDDDFKSLNIDFSETRWFSRGWTYQELLTSRRLVVFAADQTLFYCSKGFLAESVCIADNQTESLRPTSLTSIDLCGYVHRSDSQKTSIPWLINFNDAAYLKLINAYRRRILTYDSDMLNAFAGITSAISRKMGGFHWGLPLQLFVRALLLTYSLPVRQIRRPDFPSWSWLSWIMDFRGSPIRIIDQVSTQHYLVCLVHIYACDSTSIMFLLLGAREDLKGIEGYHVPAIEDYNALTSGDPLPVHPSLDSLPQFTPLGIDTSQLLIFWTHVAWVESSYCSGIVDDDQEALNQMVEVVLIAVSCIAADEKQTPSVIFGGRRKHVFTPNFVYGGRSQHMLSMWPSYGNETWLRGIAIERQDGYARRIGTLEGMNMKQWQAKSPQKELIFLI